MDIRNDSDSRPEWGGQKINRRSFLEKLAASAAWITVMGAGMSDTQASETKRRTEEALAIVEEATEGRSVIDIATASMVVAAFGYFVGWRGFAKGQPFDLDSATGMMSAQTFRMAVLGLFGNEHDREIVKEELHEVIEGLLPVGVLVILSDVTTTSLHVHPEMIDRDVATALGHDHDNVRSNSYTYRDRPRLSEDENVWKERLRQIDQDLSKQVIDMFALTSCVAPVATTYASAACANKMADEASHMIVEREYARIILEWDTDRNGPLETMRPDVILDRALDKANTLINGRSGLMKLVTTLAANAQGAALLGDPPEIYAAINHHSNPALLASLHAGGVAMSEITSLTLVYMYLRNSLGIGVDAKEFVGEFLATQIRATEGLASSVGRFYSQRRALSRGEDMATRIAAILQDSSQDRNISSEDLKKIGDILSSIQPSLVELDIRRYVDLRRRFLQRLKGEKNQFENVIATLEKSDSSIGVDEFEEILGLTPDSLANGLTPDMERKIHRLADHALHRAEQADGQQLAALFESFMAEAAADPLHPRVADADLANSSHADARSHAALLGALSKLGSKLQDTRPADTLKSFFEMDEHGGNASGVDMLAFLDAMTGPKETLQAMVDTFRFPGSHSPEWHTESHESHATKLERFPFFKQIGNVLNGLSESAREVTYALFTQLPAVPALARTVQSLVESFFPESASDEHGTESIRTKVSATQKKSAVSNLLFGVFSSVADNIAAYLASEKNAYASLRRLFGPFFDTPKFFWLKMVATLASLKIAEAWGAGTKAGNGPNFSVMRKRLVRDEGNPSRLTIVEEPFGLDDSHAFGQNHFALISMLGSYSVLQTLLHVVIGRAADEHLVKPMKK